jgi:hypothetical protein
MLRIVAICIVCPENRVRSICLATAMAAALAAALVVSINVARAGEISWQVQATTGTVLVQESMDPDARWTDLNTGQTVGPLHLLRTGRRGEAVLMRPGNRIQMKEKADLEFTDPEDGDGGKIYQRNGVATYTISGPDPVSIVTPWLVATSDWGTVTISVQDQGTTVQVHYGNQTVSSRFTGSAIVLGKEQTIRVDARTGALTAATSTSKVARTASAR